MISWVSFLRSVECFTASLKYVFQIEWVDGYINAITVVRWISLYLNGSSLVKIFKVKVLCLRFNVSCRMGEDSAGQWPKSNGRVLNVSSSKRFHSKRISSWYWLRNWTLFVCIVQDRMHKIRYIDITDCCPGDKYSIISFCLVCKVWFIVGAYTENIIVFITCKCFHGNLQIMFPECFFSTLSSWVSNRCTLVCFLLNVFYDYISVSSLANCKHLQQEVGTFKCTCLTRFV